MSRRIPVGSHARSAARRFLALPCALFGCALAGCWPTTSIDCMLSARCSSSAELPDLGVPAGMNGVFGQPDEFTNQQLLHGLNRPTHAVNTGQKLIIVDSGNHRVLVHGDDLQNMSGQSYVVIGQPDTSTRESNYGGLSPRSLSAPHSVASDGTSLLIADAGNRRVLIWKQLPTQHFQPADFVIGQVDMQNSVVGCTDVNFGGEIDVALSASGQVLVTDVRNHRALMWNQIPTQNGKAADVVLGQTTMTTCMSNAGNTAVNALGMNLPIGSSSFAGSKLVIADSVNNRVKFWDSVPSTNGKDAAGVIGQSTQLVRNINAGQSSINNAGFNTPIAVAGTAAGLLAVADSVNHRILGWRLFGGPGPAVADVVLGQMTFTTGTDNLGGLSARSLSAVEGLSIYGQKLYVADTPNNRVLVWQGLPTENYKPAVEVHGQPDYISAALNNPGSSSGFIYNGPIAVCAAGNRLAIADYYNNRVLLWHTLPIGGTDLPSLALGQPDLVSTAPTHGSNMIRGDGFTGPSAVWTDGTRLVVADLNRVLIWNSWPTTSLQAADVVLGQPDLTSNLPNSGGSVGAATLWQVSGVTSDGKRLLVSEAYNHRVLIWKDFPTSNAQRANVVLGQPDFTSNSGNVGVSRCMSASSPVSAQTLSCPGGIAIEGTRIYLGDFGAGRVLIWNAIPIVNQTAADRVLGQSDFTSVQPVLGPSNVSFLSLHSIALHNGRAYVSDPVGNRVVYWNLPAVNGQPADGFIGQPNFTDRVPNNGGLSLQRLQSPFGLWASADKLYIADTANHRVIAIDHP